jgi:replicative DNA helicase
VVHTVCQGNPEGRGETPPRPPQPHEQVADIVLLLNRPDAHGHGESDRPGEADIIVAKNRSGPVNRVAVGFQGHYSRFTAHGA